jgi:hypothetical protein
MTSSPTDAPAPVDDAASLTPEWLTAALRAAGHDLTARTVDAAAIGVGQIGTNLRLQVRWDGEAGPDTLVAKLAAGDPGSRGIVALAYRKEVGFYTDLAASIDMGVPGCWFGAISPDSTVFTLLLDDLAPAEPGDQLVGCTQPEATAALANLAGLHAAHWRDPALHAIGWLTAGGLDNAEALGPIIIDAVPSFVDRLGHLLSADDIAVLTQAADATAAWARTRTATFGLLHADYRLDNLMFSPDGTVTALDWQTLSIAPPLRDVAYFCETSLEPELRRSAERELLAGYLTALRARGVTDYDDDEAWTDYRLGSLHGVLVTVLGCVYAQAERDERADAMFAVMATRTCAAIRDLDPFTLLG